MNLFLKTVTSLTLFLLIILSPEISFSYEKVWGTDYKKFIESIDRGTDYTEFDPADKPDYRNRIAVFIYSLNKGAEGEIKIVRLKINPETDYLFYRGKLCGITENRGLINITEGEKILKNLTRKFGDPEADRKSSLYIYTFKKGRTRIILYQQLIDNKSMRCRVYSYTNDIFNTLFSD
jgi:hypothetical protein